MTIVLENRFWDLSVNDTGFAVGLSFNQVGSMLHIPFAAITAFVDPSVEFGLQFQVDAPEAALPSHDVVGNDPVAPPTDDEEDDGSNVVTVDFGRKK